VPNSKQEPSTGNQVSQTQSLFPGLLRSSKASPFGICCFAVWFLLVIWCLSFGASWLFGACDLELVVAA
jgi:hypothetical protein